MKKLVLTVLLGMTTLVGFSQIRWDAKLGMSMSNLTKIDPSGMKVGYTFGVGMDYAFTDTWALQSGLMFSSKGYKYSEEAGGDKYTEKANAHYLEIPVLAAYKMDIADNMKFIVNAGPYFAVGLGGITSYSEEYSGDKDEWHGPKIFKKYDMPNGQGGTTSEAICKRFDMGLQYGVGLEISDHYLVNLTGQYGFINPYKNDVYKLDADGDPTNETISPKNISFYISVGYRF